MKFHWGVGIIIAFAVFLIISFATIFYFMNQKVDLVTDNYYEKTLTYQTEIDEAARSETFDEKIALIYSDKFLTISFPDSLVSKVKDGELYFYRPSDSGKDFKSPFNLNEEGKSSLNLSNLEKGYWRVHLRWITNNSSYSIERTLMIN